MAGKTTPIPQDKIGESFVWREWFQKLSDRAFGTASTLDIPIQPQYGGTGLTNYNTGDILYSPSTNHLTRLPAPSVTSFLQMTNAGVPSWTSVIGPTYGGTGINSYTTGDILYSSATNVLTKLPAPTVATSYLQMTTAGTPSWVPTTKYYGAFHDTTTQTAAAATNTAITFNSTDYNIGINIGSPTSRIVISNAGNYNVQFSIQGSNTDTASDNITVWFRINGVDVTNSAGISAIPAKHALINGALVFGWNEIFTFNANDYLEMYWTTDAGTSSLATYAAGTTPAHPLSPSVAISITQL